MHFFLTGAIFDQNTEEIQNVFKYAMTVHNQNLTGRRFDLQAYVDVINTADAFKLSRLSEFFELIIHILFLLCCYEYTFADRLIHKK